MTPKNLNRWLGATAALVLLLDLPSAMAADKKCQLLMIGQLSVSIDRGVPLAAVTINGVAQHMIVDTGSSRTLIFKPTATALGLKSVAINTRFYGVGGSDDARVTTVHDFALGSYVVHDVRLIVSGRLVSDDVAGLLGEDLLSKMDEEFDLTSRTLRFFSPKDCSGEQVVYWQQPQQPYSLVPIERSHTPDFLLVKVSLNGHDVVAMIDSGATNSTVTSKLAQSSGMHPESAPVATGAVKGVAANSIEASVAVFPSLSIGDETIKNAKLRVADLWGKDRELRSGSNIPVNPIDQPDMLIGADFIQAHRMYVSRSQGKIYFTYLGGPIFRTANPTAPPTAAEESGKGDQAHPQ